jgi:hypothetical protein
MPQGLAEDLAFLAYLHFLLPVCQRLSAANGSVDEPAELTHVEFPSRTMLSGIGRTPAHLPARLPLFSFPRLQGLQKEHLPFDVRGNLSPPLFKALDGLDRRPQELRHLLLGLSQVLAEKTELFGIHEILTSRSCGEIFLLTDVPQSGTLKNHTTS